MKIKEYLLDRKSLILFYILLMTVINAVVILDPEVRIWTNDILYLNLLAFFIFLIYLLGGYIMKKNYWQAIGKSIQGEEGEIIYALPEPRNHEERLIKQLLTGLYEEQNARIEKIHDEKAEQFEYIGTWVHEIKTPISVGGLLLENSRGQVEDGLLDSLAGEIERIDRLVEQFLYYSKIDDFSRDFFINEYEIKKLVNETVKRHARTFIGKNIKLETDELEISIHSDKKWLVFILDQIISNSLKYTPAGGKIKISTQKDEREKRLVIMDSGVGIKPEDLGRVFDRGFTGHNGREFSKSTGMGLYLAQKLARKLGHEVSIDSRFGEYTRAVIHFPKLREGLRTADI